MIRLDSPAIIQASAGRHVNVDVLAYAGGVMNVPPFGEVAIDLSGLAMEPSFPLLADHDPSLDGVLGTGKGEIAAGTLNVVGALTPMNPKTIRIVDLHRGGATFQASVGVAFDRADTRRVAAGEVVRLNGRDLSSPRPFTLISRGSLREVSITSLGCDPTTAVRIAARLKGLPMPETTETVTETTIEPTAAEAAVAAERERVNGIAAVAARMNASPATLAASLAAGESLDRAELRFLRASRPQGPSVRVGGTAPNLAGDPDILTAAFLCKVGRDETAAKTYGEPTADRGRILARGSVFDILRANYELHNGPYTGGKAEMLRAALSTRTALTESLGNFANRLLLDGYRDAPATWRSFTNVRDVTDFKENTAVRPILNGALEELGKGGEIKHAHLDESAYKWKIGTFAKMLGVDRQDLINDDLGAITQAAEGLGRMAARKVSDVIYGRLIAASSAYFSLANGNLLTGSPLSIATLSAAITAMLTQRDAEGNDLDLRPAVLLVPPALADLAKQLLTSEQIAYLVNDANAPGAVTGYTTGNPNRNAVRLEIEPRLSNEVKFGSAASDTTWYLLGAPGDAPIIAGFLNGQQNPVVEYRGVGEGDFNVLQAQWRTYIDFGAALGDFRAAIKATA